MRTALTALLLCCTAMLPPSVAASTDDAVTDAATQVEARERAFAQTMAARDVDDFAGFIDAEAVFFSGDTPLRGREAIVAAWRRYFEAAQAPFSWAPDQVEVLASGHLALSSGPVLDPLGNAIGRFNSIWRRTDDGVWRVVFDKGCTACPASTPPTARCDGASRAARTPD
jgi:ketosteroid isomerase-like protein